MTDMINANNLGKPSYFSIEIYIVALFIYWHLFFIFTFLLNLQFLFTCQSIEISWNLFFVYFSIEMTWRQERRHVPYNII